DNIGNLRSGVVDVVLHIDFPALNAQQANKGIAKDCIAQVADVRCLVRVNAGVLDQNLASRNIHPQLGIGRERSRELLAIDASVDVSRASEFQLLKTIDRPSAGNDFFRDLAWSLAQLLSQFKGKGQRVLPKLDPRRLLDDELGQVKLVGAAHKV